MVDAHDHVGCEPCLDALIDLEARVDALEQLDRARRRDEAYRACVEACDYALGALTHHDTKGDAALLHEAYKRLSSALALARQAEEA